MERMWGLTRKIRRKPATGLKKVGKYLLINLSILVLFMLCVLELRIALNCQETMASQSLWQTTIAYLIGASCVRLTTVWVSTIMCAYTMPGVLPAIW